jgi:hypothetical protein
MKSITAAIHYCQNEIKEMPNYGIFTIDSFEYNGKTIKDPLHAIDDFRAGELVPVDEYSIYSHPEALLLMFENDYQIRHPLLERSNLWQDIPKAYLTQSFLKSNKRTWLIRFTQHTRLYLSSELYYNINEMTKEQILNNPYFREIKRYFEPALFDENPYLVLPSDFQNVQMNLQGTPVDPALAAMIRRSASINDNGEWRNYIDVANI